MTEPTPERDPEHLERTATDSITLSNSVTAKVTLGALGQSLRRQGQEFRAAIVGAAIALIVGAIVFLVSGRSPSYYLEAIVPTLVGIVVGVPLALWLLRAGNDAEAVRNAETASKRRALVLKAIREELKLIAGSSAGLVHCGRGRPSSRCSE